MNILTKISIVVLVVLVLAFSAISITMATAVPNYRQALINKTAEADGLKVQATATEVARQAQAQEIDQLRRQKDAAEAATADLRNKTSTEIAKLKGEIVDGKAAEEFQKATVATLTADIVFNSKQNAAMKSDLDASRKAQDKSTEELRKMTEQYRAARAEVEQYAHNMENLREQMQQLSDEAATLRKAGTAAAPAKGSEGVASASDQTYTGSVTSVKNDMAGINIGSSSGVKRGDKLVLYRGGKLVGYLRIEEVGVKDAAGVILDRQIDPVQGDKVTNKLQQ